MFRRWSKPPSKMPHDDQPVVIISANCNVLDATSIVEGIETAERQFGFDPSAKIQRHSQDVFALKFSVLIDVNRLLVIQFGRPSRLFELLDDFSISMLPYEPKSCIFINNVQPDRDNSVYDVNYQRFLDNRADQSLIADDLEDAVIKNLCDISGGLLVFPGDGIYSNDKLIVGFCLPILLVTHGSIQIVKYWPRHAG